MQNNLYWKKVDQCFGGMGEVGWQEGGIAKGHKNICWGGRSDHCLDCGDSFKGELVSELIKYVYLRLLYLNKLLK